MSPRLMAALKAWREHESFRGHERDRIALRDKMNRAVGTLGAPDRQRFEEAIRMLRAGAKVNA